MKKNLVCFLSVVCFALLFLGGTQLIAETYPKGQKVSIEWKGTWYPGVILEAKKDLWKIHYNGFNSSWDEWVPASRLKPLGPSKASTKSSSEDNVQAKQLPQKSSGGGGEEKNKTKRNFKSGETVWAQWSSGKYYKAKLSKFNNTQQFTVKWADGSEPIWVNAEHITTTDSKKLQANQIKVGMLVKAKWTNESYYEGTITKSKNAKLWQCVWNDGSAPSWLVENQIQPLKGHTLKPSDFPSVGGQSTRFKKKRGTSRANKKRINCRSKKGYGSCASYQHCKWKAPPGKPLLGRCIPK